MVLGDPWRQSDCGIMTYLVSPAVTLKGEELQEKNT